MKRYGAALAALALLVASRSALAQGVDPVDERRIDPLLVTGIGLTAASAGAAVYGAVTAATAKDDEWLSSRERTGDAFRGGAMIGAGIGAGVVGVSALISGVGAPPSTRVSEPRMVVGAVMTDMGAGMLGATAGYMRAGGGARSMGPPMALVAGGSVLLGVGIPLWATGQRRPSADDEDAGYGHHARALPVGSGSNLRTVGAALTVVGIGGVVVSGVSMIAVDKRGEMGGLALIPGFIGLGVSATFLGAGIPLWIIGASRVERSHIASVPSFTLRSNGMGARIEGTF